MGLRGDRSLAHVQINGIISDIDKCYADNHMHKCTITQKEGTWRDLGGMLVLRSENMSRNNQAK